MKLHDLTGMRSGRLTVISKGRSEKGIRYWNCRCDCGAEKEVKTSCLIRTRPYKSCGCLRNEKTSKRFRTHGLKGTRIHSIWTNMKTRGRKGMAAVCQRWVEDFQNFLQDMGQPPTKKHWLERKDPKGPYTPENCQWAIERKSPVRTHGMSHTPTWNSFQAMHYRCNKPIRRSACYAGIKVCRRWKKFTNFLEDMGERPSTDYVLGRICHWKDYRPGNCKWVTKLENLIERHRGYRPSK